MRRISKSTEAMTWRSELAWTFVTMYYVAPQPFSPFVGHDDVVHVLVDFAPQR